MKLTKRIILTILAIIGFLTSVKLTLIYLDANFNPYALPSFCSVNDLIDCDGVAKTTHSQFFGVPLAFWGLFLYFVFLFFTYVDKLKNIQIKGFRVFAYFDVFKNPEVYICAIGIIAFTISMILAFVSIFEINKICVLCFFTYILNLLIGLIAKPQDTSYIDVFKTSVRDFVDALKVKKYAVAFSVLVLVAAAILTYTSLSNVLAPQVKIQKDLEHYSSKSGKLYYATGNDLGSANAKVTVHIYSDYQCPFCIVLNAMINRAVSELEDIKFVHHNTPLDAECNPIMKRSMHPGSCQLARIALAAGQQGKYWDMNNLLFDKEYENDEQIFKAAKSIKGLNIEKLKEDINSESVKSKLAQEIKATNDLGIDGTPAIRINMDTHIGIMPYEDLKAKFIKAGAKERK